MTISFLDSRVLRIFALGFVSGLPFLLTLSTLSYWLAEQGVSHAEIGLFMIVGLPYSFKFIWAPLVDHVQIPLLTKRLGKRRSWLVMSQFSLTISLIAMGFCQPATHLIPLGITATLVAFFSASQDIIIDAYRIETISAQNRGTGAAFESIGFRFGMLVSGAGALYLAQLFSWQEAYHFMACLTLASIGFTLSIPAPETASSPHLTEEISDNLATPSKFRTFFVLPLRYLTHQDRFWLILGFIFFFKLTDTVLNAMSAPFLCDLGFSKIEFANVSKLFGITLMVMGGLLGGVMIQRLGIYQSAVLCAILQAASALMFTLQGLHGHDTSLLMITVGLESLCSGMTSAIFIALLSSFCSSPFTASQFTLLYSFGSLCRVGVSTLAGVLADQVSWPLLFLGCVLALVPTIGILSRLSKQEQERTDPQDLSFNPTEEVKV
jgi:MFS transporter, PAT family, beta-lactamase induction signal transducer AmpG